MSLRFVVSVCDCPAQQLSEEGDLDRNDACLASSPLRRPKKDRVKPERTKDGRRRVKPPRTDSPEREPSLEEQVR